MEFNEAQESAIQTIDGALLIISCPGSGKTTTMLRRIQNMVEHGVPEEQILMVTFTEAAAREMRERFSRTKTASRVTFCTLHSLCLRIINESGARRGYHIANTQELNEIVKNAVRSAGVYLEDFKNIKNDISRFKNTGDSEHRTEADVNARQFMDIMKSYEDAKNLSYALDFDDLLIVAKELLTENPVLCKSFSDRYRYVICDEYQDTNPVQRDVLYLLVKKYGNICVVGDDDQSIYGFRGATPDLMLSFPKDFPGCKVINMGTNYRSLPHIIIPSGKMIEKNKKRFAKKIGANRDGDGEIFFDCTETRQEELESITNFIRKKKEQGADLKQIALLARTNQELEEMAVMLTESNIPFSAKESLHDVYESWMFTDICSYLRIAVGSFDRSDVMRIANRPKRYLDMRIMAKCELTKDGIMRAYHGSKAYVMDALYDFIYVHIGVLRTLPFSKQVAFIVDNIGYRKYVHSYCEAAGASATISDDRLNFFIKESERFENADAWIRYAKGHIMGFKESVRKASNDGVVLATMHRSKGLEWDTVFILDCCDGNVPLVHGGKVDDEEEERRLFYVACTRAQNELHIFSYSYSPNQKGELKGVKPSLFVSELKRICAEMEEEKRKKETAKNSAQKALAELSIENASTVKIGMNVEHELYGIGKIISVRPTFLSVRFDCGIKIFHFDGR